MKRQEKTFTFPVNYEKLSGGDLLVSCSKIAEALPGSIDNISYRPNVHSRYADVTNLIGFLHDDLWNELSKLAKEQFIADDEEEEKIEEDPRYYELNEISKNNSL